MTELETIQRAKMYIDNLANGINPLNGQHLPEEDIVNNVRISRCLFYVSNLFHHASFVEQSSHAMIGVGGIIIVVCHSNIDDAVGGGGAVSLVVGNGGEQGMVGAVVVVGKRVGRIGSQ